MLMLYMVVMSAGADDMVLWPDPRLSQECEEIDDINDDVRKMAEHTYKLCMPPMVLFRPQVGYETYGSHR